MPQPDAARPRPPSAEVTAFATALHVAVLRLRRLGELGAGFEPLPMSELAVVTHVVDHPGATVTEIADALGVRRPNVSATVGTLVARGLLERHQDPADARRALVHPTSRATAARDAIEVAWARDVAELLDRCPPGERAALLAATAGLRRLTELWQPGEGRRDR